MKKLIAVAFVVPHLNGMSPSGVTTFVFQMIEGFRSYGDQFRVIEEPCQIRKPDRGGEEMSGRDSPRRLSSLSSFAGRFLPLLLSYVGQLFSDVRKVWKIRVLIGRRVIVTNQFGCETQPIALRLVFPFSRIIAISHTHPGQEIYAIHPIRRVVEKLCYWSTTEVFFNSAASRKLWEGKLNVKSIPGQVVHLGTESPDLSIPTDYPPKPEGMVDFVCVARFALWKGQMNLVRTWAEVAKREWAAGSIRARLIFVGDGECFEMVKDEAAKLGLLDSVWFLGHRPKGDLYFNGGDIAVLASTEPEAFGLVLLEAMSRGKAVIASRQGGIVEIVEEGVTGLLVNSGDPADMAKTISFLLGKSEERARMGLAGRKMWESRFSVKQMVGRFEVALSLK